LAPQKNLQCLAGCEVLEYYEFSRTI